MSYVAPEFKLNAFNCPCCGAYSNMEKDNVDFQGSVTEFILFKCAHCGDKSVWKGDGKSWKQDHYQGAYVPANASMVYPLVSSVPLPSVDMPEDVRADYEEAKQVVLFSPKAACALLRLALQKLLKHIGSDKNKIDDAIGDLVSSNKISGDLVKVADTLRIIGNNAVHPGKMDETDIAEVANHLFDFLNFFIDETITRPKKISEMYSGLPEGAREAVQRRDSK